MPLLRSFRPRRIVVLRALQLGDTLCAVPALRALRRERPHASITLVGLPWARSLPERLPEYVDDFMAFPGFPGLPEQPVHPPAFARFVLDARSRDFDLALQRWAPLDTDLHRAVLADGSQAAPAAVVSQAKELLASSPEEGLRLVLRPTAGAAHRTRAEAR